MNASGSEKQYKPARRQRKYHESMSTMVMKDENGKPFHAILKGEIPKKLFSYNVDTDVQFYLYTRNQQSTEILYVDKSDVLAASTFNVSNPTKILIHGFISSVYSSGIQKIKNAYLDDGDYNVIGIDWSRLVKAPWYNAAADHTKISGSRVAQFIDFLVSTGVPLDSIHIIGHSLGAHAAGYAASNVKSGRIPRVTGLDPALPLFSSAPTSDRLDENDAVLVDCIHTCGGLLGFYAPICTIDFYPNGGDYAQPGCWFDFFGTCSHGRSFDYYAESVSHQFEAFNCDSLNNLNAQLCDSGIGYMGNPAPKSSPGIYYLSTNRYYPYSKDVSLSSYFSEEFTEPMDAMDNL